VEPGIDYTQNHIIEFTIRIDENMDTENGSTMTDVQDRYGISVSDTTRTLPDSTDVFSILSVGDSLDWGSDAVRQWAFVDGDNDGDIDNDVAVGTGIPLVQGGVYDFKVFINVDDLTCDITIDYGTNSFTAEDLGWLTSSSDVVGGVLNFMATCDAADDLREMSIDNILITEAPEEEDIPGDANHDGKVDGSDVTILANNWQKGVSNPGETVTWEMGDFNSDGKVDGSDVTILANHWQDGVSTSSAAVPEPSTLVLLLAAVASFYVIRRRR
jgi:hypothetical protein